MNLLSHHQEICLAVTQKAEEYRNATNPEDVLKQADGDMMKLFEASPEPYDEVAEEILHPGVRPEKYNECPREFRVVTVAGAKWVIERVQTNVSAGEGTEPVFEFTRHQKLTPSYPWLHFKAWLFNNEDERYPQKRNMPPSTATAANQGGARASGEIAARDRRNPSWSLLMQLLGWVLYALRRLNLYELGKHWFPDVTGKNRTPAYWLDFYLLATWAALACLIGCSSQFDIQSDTARVVLAIFCGWWIVQILQTSVYHELWRTIIDTPVKSMNKVHSRLRNAVIGFTNVVTVTLLFGLIYFFTEAITIPDGSSCNRPVPLSLLESLYFSYTVAWSVGPVGMSPILNSFGQVVIMLQAASTLLLVGVLLSLVVSGISPLPDDTTPKSKP